VPKVEKIRGLNLPGTPRATSASRGYLLLLHINKMDQYFKDTLYIKIIFTCFVKACLVRSEKI
jgi:hypothetical protein